MSVPDSPTTSSPLKFYTPEHGGSQYSSLVSSTEDVTASPSAVMSRVLKARQQALRMPESPKRPLELLDLPVDILKEIIGHVGFASTVL
jgi:hypothetical protein